MPPCFTIEKTHLMPVVGVDEAGRGPLAGPVVAAAVILNRRRVPKGIDDSKKLCEARRADLYGEIRLKAQVGVGMASVEEIDQLNILWATMLAMTRAVEALGIEPGDVLVLTDDAKGDVRKSAEPYSTMVAGIYATKPGVIGQRSLSRMQPIKSRWRW